MGLGLLNDGGSGGPRPRPGRLDLPPFPSVEGESVVNLPEGLGRDPFRKPSADQPLPPLPIDFPPLGALPLLIPPPLPDSGPAGWNHALFAFSGKPIGALDELVDTSEEGIGDAEDAGSDFDGVFDEAEDYKEAYDWVQISIQQTLYGRLLGDGRYDKAVGDALLFQEVDPRTGDHRFGEQTLEGDGYEDFGFASTLRNQVELRIREDRAAGVGRIEDIRANVLWYLDQGMHEPVAFSFAEELALMAVDFAPDELANWMLLGKVWERTFRFDEAFTLYSKLSGQPIPDVDSDLGLSVGEGRFPRSASPRVGMALILKRLGLDAEAEAQLRTATALQDGNATAPLELGMLLLELGRAAEASPFLVRARGMHPRRNSFEALRNGAALGLAAMVRADWSAAESAFRDTVSAAAGGEGAMQARMGEAAAAYLAGDFVRANSLSVNAIDTYGGVAQLLLIRGLSTAASGGAAAEAIRDFRAAADGDPLDAAPSLAALAFWLHVLGEEMEARETLADALDLEPRNFFARWLRARWAADSGDLPGAREELRDLVAEAPRCVAVLVDLGWLLHQEGSLAAAEVALRRAEQELPATLKGSGPAPAWAEIAYRRGLNLMSMGRAEDALEAFDRALSLDPATHAARNGQAWAHYALGDIPSAVAEYGYLQDVLREQSDHPQAAYAALWQDRIQAHAKLRLWEDEFDGRRLRPGWDAQTHARLGVEPRVLDGHLNIRGNHRDKGRTRAFRSLTATTFRSFSGDLLVGNEHIGSAGLLLALENRNRQTWIFEVFRDREGQVNWRWKQGARQEQGRAGTVVPLGSSMNIEFVLDREPVPPVLSVYLNGSPLWSGATPALRSAAGSLVAGAFVETANALPVDLLVDRVTLQYSAQ